MDTVYIVMLEKRQCSLDALRVFSNHDSAIKFVESCEEEYGPFDRVVSGIEDYWRGKEFVMFIEERPVMD